MSLDPDIARFLSTLPPSEVVAGLSLQQIRAASEEALPPLQGPAEAVAAVRDFSVRGHDGHAIGVRAYWPAGHMHGQPRAGLLFAHGGGWFQCSLAVYDRPCRALANATGCVVLAVDYRLAPEHRFPIPLEDVYAALCWSHASAALLDIDPARLMVGGDSAGGNLAAAVALLARDRGGPPIHHQLLLYPALDTATDSDSHRQFGQGYYLETGLMQRCWDAYLGDGLAQADGHAVPARAVQLQGLPPCSVLVCEYDPLRDEGEQYAARLEAAGVPVRCERLPGMVHACLHLLGIAPASGLLLERCAAHVAAVR
ncbi:alpha/beta hydrolase [Stenotrophomonas sp. PD6]|uniref:alpha/beta hydrolase n=1 Tax=Stenotrophomonas sp. PD6 TaxID=3368612 RepID=UPI003BA1EB41